MAKLHRQCFLYWGRRLFLGAAPLCLDLSVPMCFLLPRAGAGASPSNAFLP